MEENCVQMCSLIETDPHRLCAAKSASTKYCNYFMTNIFFFLGHSLYDVSTFLSSLQTFFEINEMISADQKQFPLLLQVMSHVPQCDSVWYGVSNKHVKEDHKLIRSDSSLQTFPLLSKVFSLRISW